MPENDTVEVHPVFPWLTATRRAWLYRVTVSVSALAAGYGVVDSNKGALIVVAAGLILWTSVGRLIDPMPIEQAGLGLVLSSVATVVNLVVGATLVRVGRRERSMALTADGRHLLTDVLKGRMGFDGLVVSDYAEHPDGMSVRLTSTSGACTLIAVGLDQAD